MAKFKLHAPPNPLPLPPKPGARSGANHLPNFRSPNFGEKFSGPTAILTFIIIVVCMVNVGIMGYNFSYFKGTWRNNLFHSELNFLVMNCACFTGSVVGVLGTSVAPTPQSPFQKISHLYPKVVADAIYGFLSALAGTILSIQLSVYGRYFVNSFEIKVFAGVLGVVQGFLYFINAWITRQEIKANKEQLIPPHP